MNLRQLNLLHDDDPAAIRALADECGLDPVLAIGVAKLLLANDGNLASLSPRQRQCFEQVLRPLIESRG
jgi:hypothetical protein